MKKVLILFVAITLGMLCTPSASFAGPADYYAPIPVGSSANQAGDNANGVANKLTKTDATNLRFFKHAPGSGPNFKSNQVMIDGMEREVNDLVAVPGLLPKDKPHFGAMSDMIEHTSRFSDSIDPHNFFCPNSVTIEGPNGNMIYSDIDCKLGGDGPVPGSRQLEVVDVRSDDVMSQLLGSLDPMLNGIVGNASEDSAPYTPKLYPSTVGDKFSWWFFDAEENPEYDEVVTYGLAEIDGGIVTAAYDPLMLRQRLLYAAAMRTSTDVTYGVELGSNALKIKIPFSSPNIYFRNDANVGRMILSGYQSVKIPLSFADPNQLISMLAVNFAPIDVREMQFKDKKVQSMSKPDNGIAGSVAGNYSVGHQSDSMQFIDQTANIPEEGFAVVNQAPLLSLDAPNKNDVTWRQLLGVECDPLEVADFPHSLVTYTSFWGPTYACVWKKCGEDDPPECKDKCTDRKWLDWAGGRDPEDMDPNDAFNAFKIGFAGGGVFDSAVATHKNYKGAVLRNLILPAGEKGIDGNYYIYALDPVHGDRLSMTSLPTTVGDSIVAPKCTKIPSTVVGVPYKVIPPDGFAPYAVDAGKFNDDECDDLVITFRGSRTVALGSEPFINSPGQRVVFAADLQNVDGNKSEVMFANQVKIYLGATDGNGSCTGEFLEADAIEFTPDALDVQIADAKFVKVGSSMGLVIGDLMPYREDGKWMGKAFVCTHDDIMSMPNCELIRSGFATSDNGPDMVGQNGTIRDPNYLRKVADGESDGVVGPGKIDADVVTWNNIGANIAAINGLPIALPPFGCPAEDNVEVASVLELVTAGAVDANGTLLPRRCIEGGGTDFDPGSACKEIPSVTEPMTWDACCRDKCGEDCEKQYGALCTDAPTPHTDCERIEEARGTCFKPIDADMGSIGYQQEESAGTIWMQCSSEMSAVDKSSPCCSAPCGAECKTEYDEKCPNGDENDDYCTQVKDRRGNCLSKPSMPEVGTGFKMRTSMNDDDQAEGTEDTDFAYVYRPDEVHTSKGAYIARADALIVASDSIQGSGISYEVSEGFTFEYNPDDSRYVEHGDISILPQTRRAPRLPRGQVMPGPREMTVMVKAIPDAPLCDQPDDECSASNPCANGLICYGPGPGIDHCSCQEDPSTGELCDITNGSDQWDSTHECPAGNSEEGYDFVSERCVCNPAEGDCKVATDAECVSSSDCADGSVCTIECTCFEPSAEAYCGNTYLETGEACEFYSGGVDMGMCDEGQKCSWPSCQCVSDDEPIPDPDPDPNQIAVGEDEVECRVLTASSELMLKKLREDSKKFVGEPSGRLTDERFAEPQFEILCVGHIENATVKASSTDAPAIQPYATYMTKGTMLEDIAVVQRNITLVTNPVRILPVAGEADVGMGASAQVVMPELSASMAPILSEAAPLAVSSSSVLSNGSEVINRMLQFSIEPVSSGQEISISADASSSSPFGDIDASAQTVGDDSRGGALISWRFRLPADVASCPACPDFRLPEGMTIEDVANRFFDFQQLKSILASEKSGPKPLKQIANIDVEWPENLHYEAVHVQQTLAADSDVPVSKDLKFAIFGSYGSSVSGGSGGCGCVVANGAPDLGTTLPAILAFLFAGGGIAVSKIRRRKRK